MTETEMAGTELEGPILNALNKYGLAATHLALLALIDEIHEIDSKK